jgi:hypothetical protein
VTIERELRADMLSMQTQFIVPDGHLTDYGRGLFHAMLTKMVKGYTRIPAFGGWYKADGEEAVNIYQVSGLSHEQRVECIKFLLDARWSPAIGRIIRDLFVVHPSGVCFGYSYEYPEWQISLPAYHGMVETPAAPGWYPGICAAACDQDERAEERKLGNYI